jgi:hypothetical protein
MTRHNQFTGAMIWTVLVGYSLVPSARADILYEQRTDYSTRYPAQCYPDLPDFSIYEFDDFQVGDRGWTINRVTVHGYEQGTAAMNTGVYLAFVSGPDFNLVDEVFHGYEDTDGNLVFDDLDLYLQPGTYLWITAWVERVFLDGGGQWFWWVMRRVTGSEEFFHNPGGGVGWGTEPQPGSNHFIGPADLAFTIEGTEDPPR